MSLFHVTTAIRKKATQHVYVGVPTYMMFSAAFNHSKDAMKDCLLEHDISVTTAVLEGDCHIDDARNNLFRMFLESDATDLLFYDADVICSREAAYQLLQHDNVDIIGGAYPYKDDDLSFPVVLIDSGKITVEKGRVEVAGMPTGFLRISRNAAQVMYDEAARKATWRPKGVSYGKKNLAEVFYRGMEPIEDAKPGAPTIKRRSGDYQFCHNARKLGLKVYCDPSLTLGHQGLKVWTGNVGQYWMTLADAWKTVLPGHIQKLVNAKSTMEKSAAIQPMVEAFGNAPFSADHVLLSVLHDYAMFEGVHTILECGTGVSTAVLTSTRKRVMSLESEILWGSKTEKFLQDCGLPTKALKYAPIIWHDGIGKWYDFHDGGFSPDLVFIDGPKRTEVGLRSRIVNVIPNMVRHALFVIIDDADDGDGRHTIQKVADLGFEFEVISNPARRAFALGVRKGIDG